MNGAASIAFGVPRSRTFYAVGKYIARDKPMRLRRIGIDKTADQLFLLALSGFRCIGEAVSIHIRPGLYAGFIYGKYLLFL